MTLVALQKTGNLIHQVSYEWSTLRSETRDVTTGTVVQSFQRNLFPYRHHWYSQICGARQIGDVIHVLGFSPHRESRYILELDAGSGRVLEKRRFARYRDPTVNMGIIQSLLYERRRSPEDKEQERRLKDLLEAFEVQCEHFKKRNWQDILIEIENVEIFTESIDALTNEGLPLVRAPLEGPMMYLENDTLNRLLIAARRLGADAITNYHFIPVQESWGKIEGVLRATPAFYVRD